MEASAGSETLQCESSVAVESQPDSQTVLSSVKNEDRADNSHELALSVYHSNAVAVDMVNWRSDELVEVPVAVGEMHHRHNMDSGVQDVQYINKGIGQSRTWEDGYNWRKYGQKQIKGNEFPRSYYRCSHQNCQVKKQVEQSHDGHIRDVIYRGKHDHPKPQSVSHVPACTISTVQGERFSGVSSSKSAEDMSSNGNGQPACHSEPNGVPESPKQIGTRELSFDNSLEGGVQISRTRDDVQNNDDNPESKRRCLSFNTEVTSEAGARNGQCQESLESHQGQSQAIVPSASNNDMIVTVASPEMTLPVATPNPCTDMDVTSKSLVPIAAPLNDSQQMQGVGSSIQLMQTDQKGPCPSVITDRFWGDGYNWRKYGQKHIKGSEFPRSYYRCTHPNCLVKKQLECSHSGQITDLVYKGEHNHPKPQSSSHIAVGRILSIQEEGFEQFSSLNHALDKSLTSQTSAVQVRDSDVQGEGSIRKTDDKVEQNAGLPSACGQLKVSKETGKDAARGVNRQQCKLSVEVPGQCQPQALVSSPSTRNKETVVSSRELSPLTVSNSPVYMVTSRGIVPVEVDTEEKRQRQSSGNGVDTEDSSKHGLSLSMTEKLLENAYHWRKYGQKNIKGSEFPRSYYRCTHPNCQVKMQLERSHDGRIIEIVYKGKHEHPKPQPITRMAIGAILSLEEDRSDDDPDKSSKGHVQASVCTNSNGIADHSAFRRSIKNIETTGEQFNRSYDEVEGDHGTTSQKRKKEMGDLELTPVMRTPREPRVVVETLSEVDVVDDGYRWQKYGRKIVKGNSHPRNYYRCSNGGCSVKKHVERAANNPKAVITTYEGKHNHDLPPARVTTHDMAGLVSNVNPSDDTVGERPGELVTNNIDTGIMNSTSHEDDIIDAEPIQSLSNITDQSTSMVIDGAGNGGINEEADKDSVNKKEGVSLGTATDMNSSNPTPES